MRHLRWAGDDRERRVLLPLLGAGLVGKHIAPERELMDPRDRVVVAIPVQALWTDKGELSAVRGRDLDGEAIRELLRRGPLRFVVADCGCRLRWIPSTERFSFWKADVAVHLWDAERRHLEDYPDEFAYFASEWIVPEMDPIVLLEKHH